MLIIVPPSESKRPPRKAGSPVALDALSFPELTSMRERVLDALIATSVRPDALRRLFVGPALADEVARNTGLLEQPARPVLEVYTGPLHEALDVATLSVAAARRAADGLIVVSALWGALRPVDRIPSYRLNVCAHLVGIDRLEPTWRTVLPDVLAAAAGPDRVVLDRRSPSYQAIGMPSGPGDRVITLRVRPENPTQRVGDVVAKRVRGQVARHLLESGVDADNPEMLAAVLGERWPVQLDPPTRPGGQRTVSLSVSA